MPSIAFLTRKQEKRIGSKKKRTREESRKQEKRTGSKRREQEAIEQAAIEEEA